MLTISTDTMGSEPALQQRISAATMVANHHDECIAIQPFYWEMGDAGQRLFGAQVGRHSPTAQTPMALASATKWLFGAYVFEVRKGQLQTADMNALTMRTGYVNYQHRLCVKRRAKKQAALTVAACFAESALLAGRNDKLSPDEIGVFHYNGGHFQSWAVQNDLGALNNAGLAAAMMAELGNELQIEFESPQLAGGGRMTAEHYGQFLQKLLRGDLLLGAHLGEQAVCSVHQDCPQQAVHSPVPDDLHWHYSLGHWVEDDPRVGDGAFSSAGAFGFYPWIDANKKWYGLIAREQRSLLERPAFDSVQCGARMRKAWVTGVAD